MEALFEILGELLTTALITKKGIYFLLFLILLGGIFGYLYYTS
jgi:hypothetical protein